MKTLLKHIPILLLLVCLSCKKEYVPPGELATYKIPKGQHYDTRFEFALPKKDNVYNYRVIFTATCRYKTKDPENQKDWNKLPGLYFGKGKSVPGWRYNPVTDRIEVTVYVHNEAGQRVPEERSIELEIGTLYRLEGGINPQGLTFLTVNTSLLPPRTLVSVPLKSRKSTPSGLYFGGDEVAPWDILIQMDKW